MAAPGVAVPGSVVAIGSQVSPAGPQGIQGPTTVSANANNKATLGSDSLVLVQGTAAGVAATTHAQTVSGDDPQLTNARTPSAHASTHVTGGSDIIVPASASTAGLLKLLSGNTTDFVDGTNTCQNLVTAVTPTITAVRLRSYNALAYGNCNFEVDQRNVGVGITNVATGVFFQDRWFIQKAGTLTVNCTPSKKPSAGSEVVIPGTNFEITTSFLQIVLATQQASLGATDSLVILQAVEGPFLRELYKDVHSFSILCRSSVASLSFGVSFRDPPTATKTLSKLCTLGAANTWTLITLPNLPVWPSGNFSTLPGNEGYRLAITLAAGSSNINSANDTWTATNTVGAVGQSNFASNAVNSTFDIAFVQHEPGSQCSTPIDLPFDVNLSACERYYQKTYSYGTAIGAAQNAGFINTFCQAGQSPLIYMPFKRRMAKVPTLTAYSNITGASATVRDVTASADKTVTGNSGAGDGSFSGFTVTSPNAGIWNTQFHYTADTGF